MEKTGCKVIFGAPTTLAVKELMMMTMMRYIIFTCILRVNVRQQLCVVKMYVGCIKIQKFYFLLYAVLLANKLCVQRQMYFL